MLLIHAMALGDYQTNCYIIRADGSSRCCVIDPGYSPETILGYLRRNSLTLEAILLTHGHFDHVGGVKALAAETDCRVYISADELSLPPMITAGKLYYTDTYDPGQDLCLAGLTIGVIPTPGHTPGSVCLTVEDAMFSGDTLFAGSCGRTDLPGGSWPQISQSLKKLATLLTDYRVFPGHGGATTLAEEIKYNPYM